MPSPQGLELSQRVLSCLSALVEVNARVGSAACGAQSTAEMRAPPPLPWAPVPTCTPPCALWPRLAARAVGGAAAESTSDFSPFSALV